MTIKTFVGLVSLLIAPFVGGSEPSVYKTKGEAVIMKSSTFTIGIERRNIPIPGVIDARVDPNFTDIRSDSRSGWTKCRVPLKAEFGITGITERSLVFDCLPLR